MRKAHRHNSMYAQAIAHAKTTKEYRNLNKPYRRVEGYTSWQKVAAELAYLIGVGNRIDFSQIDKTNKEVIQAAKLAQVNDVPVYLLDRKLAEAFLMSDLPKGIGKPTLVMPHFVLILPKGLIKNPDSFKISWLSIEYLQQNQRFPDLEFERQTLSASNQIDCDKIRWTTMIENGDLYSANTEMNQSVEDKLLLDSGEFQISGIPLGGANTNTATEQEFTDLINKLTYQVLLYLQKQPEVITEAPSELLQPTTGVGFSSSSQRSQPMLNPRLIGYNFQHRSRKSNKKDEEDRRKYQIHTLSWWRKGHWRSIAIGKRSAGQRKLIFIPPIHIIRDKSNDN